MYLFFRPTSHSWFCKHVLELAKRHVNAVLSSSDDQTERTRNIESMQKLASFVDSINRNSHGKKANDVKNVCSAILRLLKYKRKSGEMAQGKNQKKKTNKKANEMQVEGQGESSGNKVLKRKVDDEVEKKDDDEKKEEAKNEENAVDNGLSKTKKKKKKSKKSEEDVDAAADEDDDEN